MIKFSVVDEFLEELGKDYPCVERNIVRITNLFQRSSATPVIQYIAVVATYKVHGEIVRLETTVGSVVGLAGDNTAIEHANRLQKHIADFCHRHNLEVRSGIYE